jgi:hypothetical protein
MFPLIGAALLASASLAVAQSVSDPNLTGTWSTKSNSTFTGSVGLLPIVACWCRELMCTQGFYNPTADKFTEPKHTGISYSFTADGFYEEAYYRAIANRRYSECNQQRLIVGWD